ncbi:MAG: hypothetical protein COA38_02865 [Fluviicola sp.]|nr:MAG: hypothetical protein COA38_02865 [Fluviicola sp.]
MSKLYKTPGVYVEEKDTFGSSIVSNPTAIPAFIGFTEDANNSNGEGLNLVNGSTIVREPVLVQSVLEYEQTFGGADTTGIVDVSEHDNDGKTSYTAVNKKANEAYTPGFMYPSVLAYFSNGGGSCYIISLGKYEEFNLTEMPATITNEMSSIEEAIQMAETATLILPTDLIRFGDANYYSWGTQLTDFASKEKKYFTVMDVIQKDPKGPVYNVEDISNYRNAVSLEQSCYAGAYFPYLQSLTAFAYKTDLTNVYLNGSLLQSKPATVENTKTVELVKTFLSTNYINMPPSPFMAGIYSRLDSTSGVWTPPANVAPNGVAGPVILLTNTQQESMNVSNTGHSVNAIRSFTGRGTRVWGARTNDGNSVNWKYINVRRLFISMETDISKGLEAFVFKPNVFNTWVEVKMMINAYLFGLFNQGAFAGATPETSYQVLIGLGETMTEEDILNGYMRVSIQVAPIRPAQFIELTFSQMMGE